MRSRQWRRQLVIISVVVLIAVGLALVDAYIMDHSQERSVSSEPATSPLSPLAPPSGMEERSAEDYYRTDDR